MYYFNVHTQASFAHWQSVGKGPLGAARGTLTKIPVPDMDTAAKAATAPDSMGAGIYADDKPTEIPPGSATSQAGNATTDK